MAPYRCWALVAAGVCVSTAGAQDKIPNYHIDWVFADGSRIEERVQLPPNAAIAGFGPNGTVYLRVVQGDRTNALAKARIAR